MAKQNSATANAGIVCKDCGKDMSLHAVACPSMLAPKTVLAGIAVQRGTATIPAIGTGKPNCIHCGKPNGHNNDSPYAIGIKCLLEQRKAAGIVDVGGITPDFLRELAKWIEKTSATYPMGAAPKAPKAESKKTAKAVPPAAPKAETKAAPAKKSAAPVPAKAAPAAPKAAAPKAAPAPKAEAPAPAPVKKQAAPVPTAPAPKATGSKAERDALMAKMAAGNGIGKTALDSAPTTGRSAMLARLRRAR